MDAISGASFQAKHSEPPSSVTQRTQAGHFDPASANLLEDWLKPVHSGLPSNEFVYSMSDGHLDFTQPPFLGYQVNLNEPFSYERHVQRARMFTKDGREIPSERWHSSSKNPHFREHFETFEREMATILTELIETLARKPMGELSFSANLGELGKYSQVIHDEVPTQENRFVFQAFSELVARSVKELSGAEGQQILRKVAQATKMRFPEAASFGTVVREMLLYIGSATHGMSLLKITPGELLTLPRTPGGIHGDTFTQMNEQELLPLEQRDLAKIRRLKRLVLFRPPVNLNDIIDSGRVTFIGSRLDEEAAAYSKATESQSHLVDERQISELVHAIAGEPAVANPVIKPSRKKNPDTLQARIERFMKWTDNAEERGIGTLADPDTHYFFKKTAYELQNTHDPAEFDKAEDELGALLTKCADDVTQQYALAKSLRRTLNNAWQIEKTRMQKIKADTPESDTPATAKNTDHKKVAKKVHKRLVDRHASILDKTQKTIISRADEITEASLSLLDEYDVNREKLIANPLVITKISHPLNAPDITFTAQKNDSDKYSAELTKMLWSDPILRYFRLAFGTKKWLDKKYTTPGPKVNYQAVAPARNLLQQLKPLADEPDRHGNRLKSIVGAHDTALLAASMLEPINSSVESLLKTIHHEIQLRREHAAAND